MQTPSEQTFSGNDSGYTTILTAVMVGAGVGLVFGLLKVPGARRNLMNNLNTTLDAGLKSLDEGVQLVKRNSGPALEVAQWSGEQLKNKLHQVLDGAVASGVKAVHATIDSALSSVRSRTDGVRDLANHAGDVIG